MREFIEGPSDTSETFWDIAKAFQRRCEAVGKKPILAFFADEDGFMYVWMDGAYRKDGPEHYKWMRGACGEAAELITEIEKDDAKP